LSHLNENGSGQQTPAASSFSPTELTIVLGGRLRRTMHSVRSLLLPRTCIEPAPHAAEDPVSQQRFWRILQSCPSWFCQPTVLTLDLSAMSVGFQDFARTRVPEGRACVRLFQKRGRGCSTARFDGAAWNELLIGEHGQQEGTSSQLPTLPQRERERCGTLLRCYQQPDEAQCSH
jgi:hypothetical protein